MTHKANPAKAPARSSPPRRSGLVVPNRPNRKQRWLALLLFSCIRLLSLSLRWRSKGVDQALAEAGSHPVIFIIWHNRLSMSLELYNRYLRRKDPKRHLAAVVSASRDGALLSRILELFEVDPVRGSTSRRGPQALRELVTRGRRGLDLAITPDGPRGPCYSLQDGVISLAQLSGMTVIPVSYRLSWKIQLKSWDRFQIPLPGSRCEVVVGHPMKVPRDTSLEDRERLRRELESQLRSITVD